MNEATCLKSKPMYYRRKILLNLIAAFGNKGIDKLKLQKILFLFCQDQDRPAFAFVPYKYGYFSFQATKDLNLLAQHYKIIEARQNQWFSTINPPELKPEDAILVNQLTNTLKNAWDVRTEQQKPVKRLRTRIKRQSQMLFTIGYEGKSIDTYLNELIENNVSLLCDVRKNPLSMKYGFSKNQLKKYCNNLDIMYEHIPELGIASQKRQHLNNKQDYQSLFRSYRQELPKQKNGLGQVLALLQRHNRIALTCFEKEHQNCHRHCVSDYLQAENELECSHL